MATAKSNAQLVADHAALVTMLRGLEWIENDYGAEQCPECHELEVWGHERDCELATLLAKVSP